MHVTWNQFKQVASDHIAEGGEHIYRGQSKAEWPLTTSLHRTGAVDASNSLLYWHNKILPEVQDALQGWTGRTWDRNDPKVNAEFFAFLQHNGFPTPLLDWSYSPYIAAYFAFQGVDPYAPQGEVAIFALNAKAWNRTYQPIFDTDAVTPHVSIVSPRISGNHKLASQQGLFTFANVKDIEGHISANELPAPHPPFLTKYVLEASDRRKAMRELALMGITAIQLMPSVEGICKKLHEDIVYHHLADGTKSDTSAEEQIRSDAAHAENEIGEGGADGAAVVTLTPKQGQRERSAVDEQRDGSD